MIERIVNADVKKEKLESLSTLLQVLIPKTADGGARPVAIANTIVKLAPLLPRQGRFREDLRVVIFSITMRSRPRIVGTQPSFPTEFSQFETSEGFD